MSLDAVLLDRRIAPLFWAQFLGACVHNVVRSALALSVTVRLGALEPAALVALAAVLFVLPFVVFSGLAGALTDKHSKARVVQACKLAELPIVALGAWAFVRGDVPLLLLTSLLLGLQATFLGPAKYSILGESLEPHELIGGTALIATGTFLAILLGAWVSAWLAETPVRLAALLPALSVLGLAASARIPRLAGAAPALEVGLIRSTTASWLAVRSVRSVFLSVLGISWFWFVGSAVLAVLPAYAPGAELPRALALFTGGLAAGAVVAGVLARGRIELGLVPIGSVLMTLGLVALGLRVGPASVALVVVALGSGVYTVPLYAMIQDRAAPERRSQVIAGNNLLNAGFMIASVLLVHALADVGPATVLLVLGLLNAAVAIYIYQVIPEFLLRLVIFVLARVLYRLRVDGLAHVPERGAAVLVANHVTFVDWLFIGAACRRPPRFVMYHGYFRMPVVGWFFRDGKVIPIAPAHESEDTMNQAFDRIAHELADGELVCLFPEGKLSKTGGLEPFRTGIERIIQRTPVPVVPMALVGLWGSVFSRKPGPKIPRGFRRVIELRIGSPVPPREVTAGRLAQEVATLGGMALPPPPG